MKQIKDQIDNKDIPDYVTHVTKKLEEAGFEAFLVGGCVRDLLMGRVPKDWDITTNAKPEEIIQVFEKTIYENSFGTVAVCLRKEDFVTQETIKGVENTISHETKPSLTNIVTQETEYYILEVTPYRTEGKYTDFRHPDEVVFSDNIEDDLKRRDFTINAMSYSISKGHIKDIYKGHKDIKDMLIKAVGNPETRFNEDALRMLRAVRFSCQLGFTISQETAEAIFKKSDLLKNISAERIRDEFTKIIETDKGVEGIILMHQLGLLPYVIPEILPCLGCEQGGAHIYDVFGHSLEALSHAISMGWSLEIRLAALLHDIGKPKSRRINKKGSKAYTFYGHEVVGAKIAQNILERLKYPKKTTDLVVSLIKNHMFFSDTETITLSAVRRIIQKVGQDHIWDLMKVRECDRAGMKKAEAPYRLRKYHAMIEEVLRDPISVSQLAIDGSYLIKELKIEPGPRMGFILNALLEEVLEDPTKNTKEILSSFVFKLNLLSDEELKRLGDRGKEKKEKLEKEEIAKLHIKHKIKP
jgi:putative nucleotidyltransferase with HDIG domain